MEIVSTCDDLRQILTVCKKEKKTIAFVPTMGSLHKGHLRLLEKAKQDADFLVCSIFVNPTQFNNASDLKNYPRNRAKDIRLIGQLCDVIFTPAEQEIYPEQKAEVYNFDLLDKVLEGKFRPGHFNGVAMVLRRLFELVEPDFAYFGKKDFQQMLIVKELVKQKAYPIKIIGVDTVREEDGLAYSSRNALIPNENRGKAPFLYHTLSQVKEKSKHQTVEDIVRWVEIQFKKNDVFKLEYFQIVDASTLQEIKEINNESNAIACIAAWIDNVRLIDNIELN